MKGQEIKLPKTRGLSAYNVYFFPEVNIVILMPRDERKIAIVRLLSYLEEVKVIRDVEFTEEFHHLAMDFIKIGTALREAGKNPFLKEAILPDSTPDA